MRTATGLGTYALISCVAAALAAWLTFGKGTKPTLPAPAPLTSTAAPSPRAIASATATTATPSTSAVPGSGAPAPSLPVGSAVPSAATGEPSGICPADMLLVRGDYCAQPGVGDSSPRSSDAFGTRVACGVEPIHLFFCIDRFEYPNIETTTPAVMTTFDDARGACKAEQKRLCRDVEWSFACVGPDDGAEPSPCWFGESIRWPTASQLWEASEVTSLMDRFDQRRASAAGASCRSAWGVLEMLGNVQEWVVASREGWGAFKGGHAGGAPVHCRASTNTRNLASRYLHTGFRCCADPELGKPR